MSQHPSGLVPPSALFIPSLYISFETLLCQCLPQFLQKRSKKPKVSLDYTSSTISFFPLLPLLPVLVILHPVHQDVITSTTRDSNNPFVDKPKDLSFFLLLCLILRLLPSSYWNFFPPWLPGPTYYYSFSVFGVKFPLLIPFRKLLCSPVLYYQLFSLLAHYLDLF